jgi:hypothetical protein
MSITHLPTTADFFLPDRLEFDLFAVDLYRDIHKGIRSELFSMTATAGNIAPSDRNGRLALADHILSMGRVLVSHASHEDRFIEPVLVEHAPALAEHIDADHHALEGRFAGITELALAAADASGHDRRRLGHLLYLELAAFTGAYLDHQNVEERVVMPAIQRALGIDAMLGIHMAIVSSIPPDEMAHSLAFMLPAMNLDDRVELLSGIRSSAPAEAFDAIVGLARSVLDPADFDALDARLVAG